MGDIDALLFWLLPPTVNPGPSSRSRDPPAKASLKEGCDLMKSGPGTVEEYLAALPDDRRQAINAVREVILKNLPDGYREGFGFGMIGYVIPLERYPKTYNGQPLLYAALASQKNYMSVYLMGVYGSAEAADWFEREYRLTGKRLDMGKSCVRFRRLDDLPLDLVGQAIARYTPDEFIRLYESNRPK